MQDPNQTPDKFELRVDGVLLGTFDTLAEAKFAFNAAVDGLVQRDSGHFRVTWAPVPGGGQAPGG